MITLLIVWLVAAVFAIRFIAVGVENERASDIAPDELELLEIPSAEHVRAHFEHGH